MSDQQPRSTRQVIKAGKNATQVGRDYIPSHSFNINILISLFFISVFALGGLAWAINLGINPVGNPQSPERVESAESSEP